MEQRLKQLKDEIESGVYATQTEVYELGLSFYAELRQLRASCNTWKYTIVLEMYFNLSFQIKNWKAIWFDLFYFRLSFLIYTKYK